MLYWSRRTEPRLYFLVTASAADPAATTSPAVPRTTLKELQDERVVTGCWRRGDGTALYLVVEAADEHEVHRAMGRLPAVDDGRLAVDVIGVEMLC